jgi:predicted ATPase
MKLPHKDAPRVVITGGPFSGKSTLVQALGARGYQTVPEAAILVIEELTASHGLEGQAAWRASNPQEFQARIVAKQLALEAACEGSEPIFHDRGRLDGVAYCRIYGSAVPADLEAACQELPYTSVILLDTLSRFERRSQSGRTSNRERSLAIRDALRDVYTERGLRPIELPEMPLEARIEATLASLRL